jgi:hypothetical protein
VAEWLVSAQQQQEMQLRCLVELACCNKRFVRPFCLLNHDFIVAASFVVPHGGVHEEVVSFGFLVSLCNRSGLKGTFFSCSHVVAPQTLLARQRWLGCS